MTEEGSEQTSLSSSRVDPAGTWWAAFLASAGITSMAGAIAGFVWGGIGGRIAMRVLFLTSDDRVRGITSDDGFDIGTISIATVFLLFFTAIGGAIIGFFGGLLRMVTAGPTWLVAIGSGIASAAYFGAFIVTPDGVDFRVLEPLLLAITLFVVLPGLWGVTVVVLTERLMRPGVVFPTLPTRIGDRRFGGLGWLFMIGFTIFGIVGLVDNIQDLT